MDTMASSDLMADQLTESEVEMIQAALLLTRFSQKIEVILLRIQGKHIDSMRIILTTPSENLMQWRMKKDQILFFVERILRVR